MSKTNEELNLGCVSVSFNMPDDWNGDATFKFKDGIIEIEGDVRTEGFSDDEYFCNNLTKEQTRKLYDILKVYYNER